MNLRRLILLVGVVALIAGVIGLQVPLSVPGPDNGDVGCGNGIAAIPVAVIGLVLIAGSFVVGGRAGRVRTP
jgi:hypothetical protein